jgi:hypothetical protein
MGGWIVILLLISKHIYVLTIYQYINWFKLQCATSQAVSWYNWTFVHIWISASYVVTAGDMNVVTPGNRRLRWSRRRRQTQPPPPLSDITRVSLFNDIFHNPNHMLHCLLPPPTVASQNYSRRPNTHNRMLPRHIGHLTDFLTWTYIL